MLSRLSSQGRPGEKEEGGKKNLRGVVTYGAKPTKRLARRGNVNHGKGGLRVHGILR